MAHAAKFFMIEEKSMVAVRKVVLRAVIVTDILNFGTMYLRSLIRRKKVSTNLFLTLI